MSTDQSVYFNLSLGSYKLLERFNVEVQREYALTQQGFPTGVTLTDDNRGERTVQIPQEKLQSLQTWLNALWQSNEPWRRGEQRAWEKLIEALTPYFNPPKKALEKLPRPRSVQGQTIQMPTHAYGHLYFILNWVDGKPFEIFAYIGKSGSDHQATAEGVCRLASLAFRYGIDAMEVADQLRGIQSSTPEWSNGEQIKSLEDAVSKAIKQGLEEGDPTL